MVGGSRRDTDPSHCLHDASQALKEIEAGNATGFKLSLYGRAAVERLFELVGELITLFSPVEIQYTDDHLDDGFSQTQEPIIQLVGDNFTASLYDHLNILKAATEITLDYKGE